MAASAVALPDPCFFQARRCFHWPFRLSSKIRLAVVQSHPQKKLTALTTPRSEAASPFKRKYEEEEEEEMKIKPAVRISDGNLVIKERTILTGLPDNVITASASEAGPVEEVFVGAVFDKEESNHIVPIGTLRDSRFMACFRFKLWWMAQFLHSCTPSLQW